MSKSIDLRNSTIWIATSLRAAALDAVSATFTPDSIYSCKPPLTPWHPIPPTAKDAPSLELGRSCVKACCVKCAVIIRTSGSLSITHVSRVISGIVFFAMLLIFVTHLVNPRFTVNQYAGVQALSFMVLCGGIFFTMIGRNNHDAYCFDDITPQTGANSSKCMAQGVVFTFGAHASVLSIAARVFVSLCRMVFHVEVPKFLVIFTIIGVSGIFAGIASKDVLFAGGPMCEPSLDTNKALLKIPLLVYSILGLVMVVLLSVHITWKVLQVKTQLFHSRKPSISATTIDTRTGDPKSGEFAYRSTSLLVKLRLILYSYLRAMRLLWRKYICAALLICICCTQFMYVSRKPGERLGGDAGLQWARCVYEYGRDSDQCQDMLSNFHNWRDKMRSFFSVIVILLVFPLTEIRPIMLRGWWRLLHHPRAIFCRKQSDQILDNLVMERRMRHRTFGSRPSCNPIMRLREWCYQKFKVNSDLRQFNDQLQYHARQQSIHEAQLMAEQDQYHPRRETEATAVDPTDHQTSMAASAAHGLAAPDAAVCVGGDSNTEPTKNDSSWTRKLRASAMNLKSMWDPGVLTSVNALDEHVAPGYRARNPSVVSSMGGTPSMYSTNVDPVDELMRSMYARRMQQRRDSNDSDADANEDDDDMSILDFLNRR